MVCCPLLWCYGHVSTGNNAYMFVDVPRPGFNGAGVDIVAGEAGSNGKQYLTYELYITLL